ncbi:serine/threonine-protein kinase [Brachybacterium sp. ACRRE]|uniref:serine/threonine-protein kinase n=1 Tax=Brachybacterium sp. ACRRE TaxID=2918184 RepID=UPI001EF33D64|nr:serine/threonine-protein kinase [Brachybacterium sp. ACRRE]MCG7309373.1 protein kinase [Brachybacterium sp. ACRRE]
MADVIVGRFALIDLIAKGGSGAVWRSWDSKTRRLCAAKVLRQRDSADLMRFVREKGVSFDHPHLLTPYGWGAEDEHVVIAMPLASGGTLESMVRARGPLGEPAVVVLLDQLLDGLAHVHSHGWIHRDVKPANIMLESTGPGLPHSRLADFGIAVHETDVRFTSVGMINGTPGYMAPELFSMAEPHPSHDLYAAGVVALFALNGPFPLRDGAFRPEELSRRLRGVSPKLAAVIRRMLDPQPERRYQDAPSVRRDLPRVPPGLPLGFADGAPLHIPDTLPPLPPDAPGVQRPEAPARTGPSMEEIRQGSVSQAFTPRPGAMPQRSPQQGPPQQGPPHLGPPSQQRVPQQGHGQSAAPVAPQRGPQGAGSYPYGGTPRNAAGQRLVDGRPQAPAGQASASHGSAGAHSPGVHSAGTGERPGPALVGPGGAPAGTSARQAPVHAPAPLPSGRGATLLGAGVGAVLAVVIGVPTAVLLVTLF